MNINLRPYHQQLITSIRLQYQLGKRSVLAVLSKGGGNEPSNLQVLCRDCNAGKRDHPL